MNSHRLAGAGTADTVVTNVMSAKLRSVLGAIAVCGSQLPPVGATEAAARRAERAAWLSAIATVISAATAATAIILTLIKHGN